MVIITSLLQVTEGIITLLSNSVGISKQLLDVKGIVSLMYSPMA